MLALGKKIKIEVYTSRASLIETKSGILVGVYPHHIAVRFEDYKESYSMGDLISRLGKAHSNNFGENFKFYQKVNGGWEQIIVPNTTKNLRELIK